jgi:hypothetical protein
MIVGSPTQVAGQRGDGLCSAGVKGVLGVEEGNHAVDVGILP